jgi:hypothetical protein
MSRAKKKGRWPSADPNRVLTLLEVTGLTTLSPDSLKRHHADKLLYLSRRRLGMRLGDALAIGTSKPE